MVEAGRQAGKPGRPSARGGAQRGLPAASRCRLPLTPSRCRHCASQPSPDRQRQPLSSSARDEVDELGGQQEGRRHVHLPRLLQPVLRRPARGARVQRHRLCIAATPAPTTPAPAANGCGTSRAPSARPHLCEDPLLIEYARVVDLRGEGCAAAAVEALAALLIGAAGSSDQRGAACWGSGAAPPDARAAAAGCPPARPRSPARAACRRSAAAGRGAGARQTRASARSCPCRSSSRRPPGCRCGCAARAACAAGVWRVAGGASSGGAGVRTNQRCAGTRCLLHRRELRGARLSGPAMHAAARCSSAARPPTCTRVRLRPCTSTVAPCAASSPAVCLPRPLQVQGASSRASRRGAAIWDRPTQDCPGRQGKGSENAHSVEPVISTVLPRRLPPADMSPSSSAREGRPATVAGRGTAAGTAAGSGGTQACTKQRGSIHRLLTPPHRSQACKRHLRS